MVQQSAHRLGETDSSPPWSVFFGGASGAWSHAGDRRITTPVIARSPEGLIIGSLDVPAIGLLPGHAAEAAAVAALRRRLAAAMLELDRCHRMMVTAGHDLRQPLQVLAMVLNRFPAPAPRLGDFDLLEVARDAIGRLTEGLSELARAGFHAESATTPRLRQFAVSEAMDAAIERWAQHIRAGRTRFRYVRSSAAVVTDPALLATILDNLLGNAIKYASGRSVLFGCRRRDGRLAVEILDTGPGMTEDQLHSCRGARGNPSSGGLGLGLYIVRRTVELLGLDLLAASEPGRGSRFAIYLPVA